MTTYTAIRLVNEGVPPTALPAIDAVIGAMESMPADTRAIVMLALSDYFCRRCGRHQPPGDCQCKL